MSFDESLAASYDDALRVLVVNGDVPPRDRDSGSLRLFRILELLAEEGHKVTVVGLAGLDQDRAVADLVALGIDVFPLDRERLRQFGAEVEGPGLDFPELLAQGRFDIAVLSHFDIAEKYLTMLRVGSPLTRIVIDTVDVHWLREHRGASLTGDVAGLAAAERTRIREQTVYRQADALVAVSDDDVAALRRLAPAIPVFIISNVHVPAPASPGFETRRGLVFVGNFRHTPNVDAVLEFERTVWPLIRAELPDANLTVVGTHPPDAVRALQNEAVTITGWVPDVGPHLDAARVSIAPLRYGAGVKGKIGEALGRGLPVVTTSIGAEGMGLRDRQNALTANDPAGFAAAVLRLHRDQRLWERLSAAGRAHVDQQFGLETARAAVRRLLAAEIRTPFVLPSTSSYVARTLGAYIRAFSCSDPATLVLTVPADGSVPAQTVFDNAAATLAEHGVDPEEVADIRIVPTAGELVLPGRAVNVARHGAGRRVGWESPVADWRRLAGVRHAPRRHLATPRAAVLLHAVNDVAVVSRQLEALERANLSSDVDLIVAADAPDPQVESLLSGLGDVRVIRGSDRLGRHQAWQLAAHTTAAPFVVALAPLSLPEPGFVQPLLDSLLAGAVMAAPVVAGSAGLRIACDGSLWPREAEERGAPDALPLDCIAASRELVANGLPVFPRVDGLLEAQLAGWVQQRGPIAVAAGAQVNRIAPPPATVIVCTRNRSSEVRGCVTLLLGTEVHDIVVVDNDSTDDTAEVVAELSRRSGGIVRLVQERRLGASHARNAGAAAARSDLLLYIDDDARPAPGWLNHLAWTLARPGVVHAGGPISGLWPPNMHPAGWPGLEAEPLLAILDMGEAECTVAPPYAVYGPSWAVRRGALEALGGFDPEFGPAPDSRINGEETSIGWRLHQEGLGSTVYSPGASVGHRVAAHRIDDWVMLNRALCAGVEWPRIRQRLGEGTREALLWWASAAARRLLAALPLSGEMSVSEALERISRLPGALPTQTPMALALGELAGATALLGETCVMAGDLRLEVEPASLLKGFITTPASPVPVS